MLGFRGGTFRERRLFVRVGFVVLIGHDAVLFLSKLFEKLVRVHADGVDAILRFVEGYEGLEFVAVVR